MGSSRTKNRMEQLSHQGWKKHKKSMLRSCSKTQHKKIRGKKMLTLIHKTPEPNSSWGSPSPHPWCSQWHILLPTVVSMFPYRAVGMQEHPTQHHPLLLQQGHLNSSWLGFPLCRTGIKLQSWQRSENLNSLMSINPSEVLIRKAQQKRKVLSLIQTDLPLEISPFEL